MERNRLKYCDHKKGGRERRLERDELKMLEQLFDASIERKCCGDLRPLRKGLSPGNVLISPMSHQSQKQNCEPLRGAEKPPTQWSRTRENPESSFRV